MHEWTLVIFRMEWDGRPKHASIYVLVHTFGKMNRHNYVGLKVLLRRVFDFAYAVCNCTNFIAGAFKGDAQYLMPKKGLMCPDPNNSNDRRRLRTGLSYRHYSHKYWWLAVRELSYHQYALARVVTPIF